MDTLRDAPAGQLLRALGFKTWLSHPEERGQALDFSGWQTQSEAQIRRSVRFVPSVRSFATTDKPADDAAYPPSDDLIVGWYSPVDQANPLNWSTAKKCLVLGALGWLTWTVYLGAAIVSPAAAFLIVEFELTELQ